VINADRLVVFINNLSITLIGPHQSINLTYAQHNVATHMLAGMNRSQLEQV